jgi:hypothetical protein
MDFVHCLFFLVHAVLPLGSSSRQSVGYAALFFDLMALARAGN